MRQQRVRAIVAESVWLRIVPNHITYNLTSIRIPSYLLKTFLPRGSNVVPFWLWPIFFLGIIIYCPKKNYIGALGY